MLAGIGAGYDQETLLFDMQRYFAPQSLARGQRYWQEKRVLSCDLADIDTFETFCFWWGRGIYKD